jgi:molybdopterin-guanine dinucleotide biosynthesis protein A
MGRPKAWLPFGDELMLQRVVRILGEVVDPIVVVAAPGQDVPPLPTHIDIARDENQGRGPLEGLAAGLRRLLELGIDAAYASSTDTPFLQSSFIRRIIELLGESSIAVPYVDERHHPLAAVYRTTVLTEIDRLLAADRLRPIFLFDAIPTRKISASELESADPELHSLRNLNSPEDYENALRELSVDS